MGSYNTNIPLVTDQTLLSYHQIKANFQAINAAFGDNHVPLAGDQALAGKHNLLALQAQSGDPATSATQVALYNKIVSSIPELFYRPSTSGTPIQMTYPSIGTGLASTNPNVYLTQQYSFIPGPFIVYAGIIKAPTNGQVVTLSPGTTLLYVDLIVANNQVATPVAPLTAAPTGITGTSFTISYSTSLSSGSFDIYYLGFGQ